MAESTLTLKFRGIEGDILEEMVSAGLFNSKSEAVRSSLVHYAIHLDLFKRKQLWKGLQKVPRRKVSPKQLAKDLEALENEN